MTDDDRLARDLERAILRRLHDTNDVLVAVAAAARLLSEQIDLVVLEVMELARRAEEGEGEA
jgi:hypothetical protein